MVRRAKLLKLILWFIMIIVLSVGFICAVFKFLRADELNDIVRYGIMMIGILIAFYGNKD